jgi:hypothetical protein
VAAGSLSAARHYMDAVTRLLTLEPPTATNKGADQGATNTLIYVAAPLIGFPHDVFLLSNPALSPVLHHHYFDRDLLAYHEEGTFVGCGGDPVVVLHQMDRKIHRNRRYLELMDSRYDPSDPW